MVLKVLLAVLRFAATTHRWFLAGPLLLMGFLAWGDDFVREALTPEKR